MRVEHEDHANSHGFAVGANMAGADEPYDHLPFFYSDLFELGYEAVGEVDSRHETLAEWKRAEPRTASSATWTATRRPRGFLLWDVWGRVDDATALIAAGEPITPDALRELLGLRRRLDRADVADVVRVDEHVVLAAGREVGEHLVRLDLAAHDVVAPTPAARPARRASSGSRSRRPSAPR